MRLHAACARRLKRAVPLSYPCSTTCRIHRSLYRPYTTTGVSRVSCSNAYCQPAGRTSVIPRAERERLIPFIPPPTSAQPAPCTRHVSLLPGGDQVADALCLNRNQTLSLLKCRNSPTQAKGTHNAIPSQRKRHNGIHPQNASNPGETSPHLDPFLAPAPQQAFARVGSDGYTRARPDFVLRRVIGDQAEGSRHVFCVTKRGSADGCRDAVLRQFAAPEGNQGHPACWRWGWKGGSADEEGQVILLERFPRQDV